jgi:hypothetical protein
MRLLELVAIAVHDLAGNLYASFNPDGEPKFSNEFWGPLREGQTTLATFCYCHTEVCSTLWATGQRSRYSAVL